jgi:hypothetical protein
MTFRPAADERQARNPTERPMSIKSPCTSVCRMSPTSGFCEGCFRTIPEITEWSRADEGRRQAILAEVAARKAAAGSGVCVGKA